MTIQEILINAEYICDGDNRNRAIKGCNMALEAGIKIIIVKKGYHRSTKTGKHWDVKVKGYGKMLTGFLNQNGIDPYVILARVAKLIKDPEVREQLKLHATTPSPCGKCNGSGFIPQFAYYANGVCFDCMGLGVRGKFEISKIN